MKLSERQLQIVQAATELIGQNGIQELTTKSLAAFVGVSEAALYRHFDSKLAILETMLEFFYEQSSEKLALIMASEGNSMKKLDTLLSNQIKHFSAKPAIISVIYSEGLFLNEKKLSEKILKIMDSRKETVTHLITSGQEEKIIRTDIDAECLAITVLGGIRLLILRWKISGYAFSLDEEGHKLIKAQLTLLQLNQET